jgi:hypothetical protein
MAFIHKDYGLPQGKMWTVQGWYRHGLQELKALIIVLPLAALLAWGAYTMIGALCSIYPDLARAGQVYFWACVALVPFSAFVCSRFFWWTALGVALLIYPVAHAVSAWIFALLALSVPFRCIWAYFCHACRESSAPEYVHVVGASGWR